MLTTVFKDIAGLLLKSAPSFSKALMGPAANFAIGLLSKTFGGDIINPIDVAQKIHEDVDAENKLCNLESTYSNALLFIEHYLKPPTSIEVKINWN